MSHPDDLHDYLIGALGEGKRSEVEAHLRDCDGCREELRQLNETLEALVETLPPVKPPDAVLDAVKARTLGRHTPIPRPDRRPFAAWGLAAVLGLLLTGAVVQVTQSRRALQHLHGESRLVADRLSLDGAVLLPLRDVEMSPLGSLILLPDEHALYILKDPPPQAEVYQVWGIGENDDTASLGFSERTVFEIRAVRYRRLRLSIEPAGGSPQPTRVLNEIALTEPD